MERAQLPSFWTSALDAPTVASTFLPASSHSLPINLRASSTVHGTSSTAGMPLLLLPPPPLLPLRIPPSQPPPKQLLLPIPPLRPLLPSKTRPPLHPKPLHRPHPPHHPRPPRPQTLSHQSRLQPQLPSSTSTLDPPVAWLFPLMLSSQMVPLITFKKWTKPSSPLVPSLLLEKWCNKDPCRAVLLIPLSFLNSTVSEDVYQRRCGFHSEGSRRFWFPSCHLFSREYTLQSRLAVILFFTHPYPYYLSQAYHLR